MLGDLLMEVNGTMTSVAVGKPVPEGSRVDAEVASEISGKVNGASLETHYVIIRPDGRSGYGEGRALLNTANGDAIQVHYPLGMGRSTSPGTFTVKGCVLSAPYLQVYNGSMTCLGCGRARGIWLT
jgi:hypothetical protein